MNNGICIFDGLSFIDYNFLTDIMYSGNKQIKSLGSKLTLSKYFVASVNYRFLINDQAQSKFNCSNFVSLF
jgi:hypothetical protein